MQSRLGGSNSPTFAYRVSLFFFIPPDQSSSLARVCSEILNKDAEQREFPQSYDDIGEFNNKTLEQLHRPR